MDRDQTTAFKELGRLYRNGRRLAGRARQQLFPTPELSAWKKARRAAEQAPRFTRGRIQLLEYDLEYVDLLTLCPQWYDLFVRETFKAELATESPRILDCGANVGLASLYLKKRHPRARITAFEPDPGIAEVLRGNLQRNGCGDIEVVEAAVWTADGSVEFRQEGADSGTIEEFACHLSGTRTRVASVRLARLLEAESVDLLKLDIEGSEEAVLQDARAALGRVRVLLMDLHEVDAERRLMPKVLDLLDEAGFVWSLADLYPLPWRPPVASPGSPFPGTHLCWSVLMRAWKEPR